MVMKKYIFAVLVYALLLTGASDSFAVGLQTRGIDGYTGDIDAYMETSMKQAGIHNLSIGIVRNGEVVYLRDYGRSPDSGDIIYPIGSLSKMFTALAVRQLINDGKLKEDAPVGQYLPGFSVSYQGNDAVVTIGQLIRHTSGISVIDGGMPYIYKAGHSLSDIVQKSLDLKLNSKPGTVYEYSNLNYIFLGRIVEVVSGRSYMDYVNENILEPLRMEHTFPTDAGLEDGKHIKGHMPFYGAQVPVSYRISAGDSSAGGFLSTAEDLCRFMICYQQGSQTGEGSLISGNEVSDWQSSGSDVYYDIYWTIINCKPGMRFTHNGSLPGYSSSVLLDTDSGYSIVVLANSFDQMSLQINASTPWSIAEDVLEYLTTGRFPERTDVKYDYSIMIWLICLLAGLLVFTLFMLRCKIKNKLIVIIFLVIPILWIVLVPLIYDSSWEWLLVSNPAVNVGLLCIMTTLALVGIVKILGSRHNT